MANIFGSFINSLRIRDDEEDDDGYDAFVVEQESKNKRRAEKPDRSERNERSISPRKAGSRNTNIDSDIDRDEELLRNIQPKQYQQAATGRPTTERLKSGNLIQLRTTPKGSEICIMRPTCFEDAMDICDMLTGNRATVVNLEGFDVELAQRVVDFVCGAIYVQKGNLRQISEFILIVAPETFDISGDYLDIIAQNGFEVPTFNKEF